MATTPTPRTTRTFMADALRRRALPLGLLLACAWGHPLAQACRCPGQPGPATAYARAEGVLLGEVLRVEPSPDPAAASQPDPGEQRAWLRVTQAWKQAYSTELWVYTRTTCAYTFVPGQQVLLHTFVDRQRGQLHTRQCMGNQPADQAQARLNWLQRHGRALPASAASR